MKPTFSTVTGADFARSLRWAAEQPPSPFKLANDRCRCHDVTCERASECQRFLQRATGGEYTPNTQSLRIGTTCHHFTK